MHTDAQGCIGMHKDAQGAQGCMRMKEEEEMWPESKPHSNLMVPSTAA